MYVITPVSVDVSKVHGQILSMTIFKNYFTSNTSKTAINSRPSNYISLRITK
jgi:hypothetical protein